MCGILAVFTYNAEPFSKQQLKDSLFTIRHRGPDDFGIWLNGDISLCHCRLSILDLSAAGHQPMSTEDDRYCITYNGEIYNHLTIREILSAKGHVFRSKSDTEVVLYAYKEWGPDCVKHFAGMFAFAIWDSREKSLFVARDHLGIKPLYYHHASGKLFVCASTLSPMFTLIPGLRSLNTKALRLFLETQGCPAPQTMVKGVNKLEAGQCLLLDATGSLKKWRYWDLLLLEPAPRHDRRGINPHPYIEELDDLLTDIVREQLTADVPVGAFLSGGVDSAILVALMKALMRGEVVTFTAGFPDMAHNESAQSAAVARHLNITNHIQDFTEEELQSVLGQLPKIADEPVADPATLPLCLLSREARHLVKVVISGDGGDELFGGYQHYLYVARLKSLLGLTSKFSSTLFNRIASIFPSYKGRVLARGLMHRDWIGLFAFLRSFTREISIGSLLMEKEIGNTPSLEDLYRSLLDRSNNNDPGILELMMRLDIVIGLEASMLVKSDRATMMYGLEQRVPLLDHRFVEFVQKIPIGFRFSRNSPNKQLLRSVMAKYYPMDLTKVRKHGFVVPLRDWFRMASKRELLGRLSFRNLSQIPGVNATYAAGLTAEHATGKRNHEGVLWALLCLIEWMQYYSIDGFRYS
jgi:asparagine synthase (glutamine-hydrolysing)